MVGSPCMVSHMSFDGQEGGHALSVSGFRVPRVQGTRVRLPARCGAGSPPASPTAHAAGGARLGAGHGRWRGGKGRRAGTLGGTRRGGKGEGCRMMITQHSPTVPAARHSRSLWPAPSHTGPSPRPMLPRTAPKDRNEDDSTATKSHNEDGSMTMAGRQASAECPGAELRGSCVLRASLGCS